MKFLIALLLSATLTQAQTLAPAQLEHLRVQAIHALKIDDPLPPVAARNFGSFDATTDIRIEHVTFATQ